MDVTELEAAAVGNDPEAIERLREYKRRTMLCEAAVVDEKSITEEGFDVRSCGQRAVKLLRLTVGPQAGEQHPACQQHFEEMAKEFSDNFEIVEDYDNVA